MTPKQIAAQLSQAEKDRLWCSALADALFPHLPPHITAARHAQDMARLRFANTDQFWDEHYTGVSYPAAPRPVPYSQGEEWIARNRAHPSLPARLR